jgi:uncharacterized protein YecE (DUF72 family)
MESEFSTDLSEFRFRNLHPRLFLGTMSDRYAGWLGQVYSEEKYSGRLTRRGKQLGGRAYTEEVLPVESVNEYFLHFPALEIDFTFYRPLLDHNGNPTPNYHVLRQYRRYMGEDDRVFLKVPQAVCARMVRRSGTYVANKSYLDAALFTEGFFTPAGEIMGDTLHGMIFEQEYQRRESQSTPELAAEEWDRFFEDIPSDLRYHLELRTARLLAAPLFAVLEKHAVGLVLSHWTWLPSLREQWERSGGGIRSGDHSVVIRLVTPRAKTYEETYAAAHPFAALVEGMLHDRTVEDTVEIVRGVVRQGSQLYLFINNRAGGNAPLIAQRIAGEIGPHDFHSKSPGT